MSQMKEKMHTGELYLPGDKEIMEEQVVYQDLLCDKKYYYKDREIQV